jgi:rRNA maturation protein Nop10
MKEFSINLILWILASPILFVLWILRTARNIRFWKMSYTLSIPCSHCGARVPLVGIFRCGCGATTRSHLLDRCGICGSIARIARCGTCGVTQKLPEAP